MLLEDKALIGRWREHYNRVRPHSSLGYRPPAPHTIDPSEACSATLRSPLMAQTNTISVTYELVQ
jgi:putative transposase